MYASEHHPCGFLEWTSFSYIMLKKLRNSSVIGIETGIRVLLRRRCHKRLCCQSSTVKRQPACPGYHRQSIAIYLFYPFTLTYKRGLLCKRRCFISMLALKAIP